MDEFAGQWGNGRKPSDLMMQGNISGDTFDNLRMYNIADGTDGRRLYDLYADGAGNLRAGESVAGSVKTGDTIASGRDIYLSTNPYEFINKTTFYAKELQYLKQHGYRFIKEGDIWRAIQ